MYNQNNEIRIERFTDKKYLKRDFYIVSLFVLLFLIIGLFEKNLILPNNGFGLFEHINIWIFLSMNIIIPIIINKLFKDLENNINKESFEKLKKNFYKNTKLKFVKIMLHFFTTIGFCCFIGNSLQNANLINHLPFDFWDSINYVMTYIISRFYKYYLFVYFIPITLTYIFILIKSISELLIISEKDMKKYPIQNYAQLNTLCNFGLNILLTILIPLILSSGGAYFIHERLDITTVTTISISAISALISFSMYIVLINKFYFCIIKYKNKNIEQINSELSIIHHNIFNSQFDGLNQDSLEIYLKKEKYLCQIKDKIDNLSNFPFLVKAVFTSLSPFIPIVLKAILQLLNAFFKPEILATIL